MDIRKKAVATGHRLANARGTLVYFKDVPIDGKFTADHWGKPGRTTFVKRDEGTGTESSVHKLYGHKPRSWVGRTAFFKKDIVNTKG